MRRAVCGFLIACCFLTAGQGSVEAGQILYATSLDGGQIVRVDVGTNVVTVIASTPSADSLVFNSAGNIVYTAINAGQLRSLNPVTAADTLIAGGFNGPRDVALEPGGATVLVSDFNNGRLARVVLATGTVSNVLTGVNTDGISFDALNRLYVVVNRNEVREINAATGATIRTTGLFDFQLDGLTYDSFSGKLYVTTFNGGIYLIDPNTLGLVPTFLANSGGHGGFDGITSDAAGNLYVAARNDFTIYQYNLAGSTLTARTTIFGLDDLAPASGLGAAEAVPEPASIAGMLIGAGSLCGYALRRRKTRAD